MKILDDRGWVNVDELYQGEMTNHQRFLCQFWADQRLRLDVQLRLSFSDHRTAEEFPTLSCNLGKVQIEKLLLTIGRREN